MAATKENPRLVKIAFYHTQYDAQQLREVAGIMHKNNVIPHPTLGAFAKAASIKWYNEINQVLKNEQKRTRS